MVALVGRATLSLYHWYWRLLPVAVIERLKLAPLATVVLAVGCTVIAGWLSTTLTTASLLVTDPDEFEMVTL